MNGKKYAASILGVISLLLITSGVTLAFFNYAKNGQTENSITTDGITFVYNEESKIGRGILIEDASPMTDEQGKAQTNQKFDFRIVSRPGNTKIKYTVTARKISNGDTLDDLIDLYLTDQVISNEEVFLDKTAFSELDNYKSSTVEKILYEKVIDKTDTTNGEYNQDFRLRMWLDNSADFSDGTLNNKEFKIIVNVNAENYVEKVDSKYVETILNGTEPVLTDNLVPIIIANDGTVTKADLNSEWYNYENKEWANAVVLVDNTQSYDAGDIISESNIQSYFVWIPRYKYKIFNTGNYDSSTTLTAAEQIIDVVFENKDTPVSSGTAVGEYLTHPAFTAFDTNGIWVGKFETGYNGATSKSAAEVNGGLASDIIIKPNVYSWRGMKAGYMFTISYDYLRNEDSHMMKNTEWGAVAYLQHSNYGSHTSVRVNNNGKSVTGYAATLEPTLGYNMTSIDGNRFESIDPGLSGTYTMPYNTSVGYTASTTGNITGIYDMSGGTWEYVMAYISGKDATNGFTFTTTDYDSKYFDVYGSSSDNLEYYYRKLGDATGEMGPFQLTTDPDERNRPKSSWYQDHAYFLSSPFPWFIRGGSGSYGTEAGIFAFADNTGNAYDSCTFRVVLAPSE